MRLEVGDIIKTNYGTGPYVIKSIMRNCTGPAPLDEINLDNPPESLPHIHLVLEGGFYLSGYDEATLKSVWDHDFLIYCGQKSQVQTTFL